MEYRTLEANYTANNQLSGGEPNGRGIEAEANFRPSESPKQEDGKT